MKTHALKSFYKYYTVDTLKRVLRSKEFRWSSPLIFNDPFDHLFSISLEDKAEDLKEWFLSEYKRFVFDAEEPRIPYPNIYSDTLLLLRNSKTKVESTEIIKALEESFNDGKLRSEKFLNVVNEYWKRKVPITRIFCVTEELDNLLMWAHYTENHQGAVIEIKCIEELDTPLCAATKVKYQKKMPKLGSHKEVFLHGLGLVPERSNPNLYLDLAYVKSDDWSYEKEWRCIVERNNEKLYDDFPFFPEEIASVYFGCRIDKKNKEELLLILKSDYPGAQIFEMQIDDLEYRLIPNRI